MPPTESGAREIQPKLLLGYLSQFRRIRCRRRYRLQKLVRVELPDILFVVRLNTTESEPQSIACRRSTYSFPLNSIPHHRNQP
jgi:hypothetical protein